MAEHILAVDDDALLRRSLVLTLERRGYRVSTAASAEDALLIARRETPSLVLLDINLPGMDGLEALRWFRQEVGAPVIFLTARRRELDEVLGLELGADDYITKPFDMDVLLARVRNVLRRARTPFRASHDAPQPLTVGDISIDPAAHEVTVAGEAVELPPIEFDILHTLAARAGQVVSIDELLSTVWGPEYVGESQVVYVHMRWLREKVEEDPRNPRRIVTIRGVGYRLQADAG